MLHKYLYQTLIASGVDLPNDGFGGEKRLSLAGDLAAVGAPGVETVFLYRRSAVKVGGESGVVWTWGQRPVVTFMSSDFDYDVVHLKKTVHRQVRASKVE